jgi:DNA-binding Lrp family transcriptional regulator
LRAYVFVSVRAEKLENLVRQIADIPRVRMVETCRGLLDIFVVAEGEDTDEIRRLVIDKIRSFEGVERIKVLPPHSEPHSKPKRERVAPRSRKKN